MYVCMYVCMYACMHACMYVRTYVCMYVCMYISIYIYIYISAPSSVRARAERRSAPLSSAQSQSVPGSRELSLERVLGSRKNSPSPGESHLLLASFWLLSAIFFSVSSWRVPKLVTAADFRILGV